MKPFSVIESRLIPLDRAHVDTDQIIPKQFLKTIGRTGLGRGLFFNWRQQPDFVLNRPDLAGAQILVAEQDFGCGSSREHATWALLDFGIHCVIAPSFGDIFFNNACKNGLLPVRLPSATVRRLLAVERLRVDLQSQTITGAGEPIPFAMDSYRRQCLLQGLDDIALTLQHVADIQAYELAHA
ncbi:MAG: 3-isopropylmalate dehydratase small subunit [Terriglobales bacterium]